MLVNVASGENVDEIADGIYRINTSVTPDVIPGGFSFNQYLIVDEQPLLFHTGPRRMFALVSDGIKKVMPLERLRYIGLSHFEGDECGSLNEFLAVAPNAEPLCSRIAAMTSIDDMADRPAKVMADNETLSLGKHTVRWLDTPHLPHGWECGYLIDDTTSTFLCGDLFTQPGTGKVAVTDSDILGPAEALRSRLDYFSHTTRAREMLERLAALRPRTLACMHGSAWRGDGEKLLKELAKVLCS